MDDPEIRLLAMLTSFGEAVFGIRYDSGVIFAVGMASLVVIGCRDEIERWL